MQNIAVALRSSFFPVSPELCEHCEVAKADVNQSNRSERMPVNASETSMTASKTSDHPEMELHLNIWKIKTGFTQKSSFFLDMGIMTDCSHDEICLYVPFSLDEKKPWEDLGDNICKNNDLLCAIFNEDCRAVAQENSCFYQIELLNKTDSASPTEIFFFYTIGYNNVEVTPDRDAKGTWLKIKVENCLALKSVDSNSHPFYYLRFRLFLHNPKQFVETRHLSNDLIQAAFSELDLYDIRINEQRNLNKKVREKITVEGYTMPFFSKIHVFYIADTKVSVETASSVKCDSRIIEPSVWRSYEPVEINEGIFIAHHWKQKPETSLITEACRNCEHAGLALKKNSIKAFNLFFTAKYPKFHALTLAAYLSVVILLGFTGSWLSSTGEGATLPSVWKLWIITGLAVIILWHTIRAIRVKIKFWKKQL